MVSKAMFLGRLCFILEVAQVAAALLVGKVVAVLAEQAPMQVPRELGTRVVAVVAVHHQEVSSGTVVLAVLVSS